MLTAMRVLCALGLVFATAEWALGQGNWGMRRPPKENRRINLNLRDAQDGYPIGSRPPWHYGYNLHDYAAGYFGGGNYREYYAYGRGGVSLGNFPDSLPGPVWTRDPKRTPWLNQLPIFSNPLTDPTDKEKTIPGEEQSSATPPKPFPKDQPETAPGNPEKPGNLTSVPPTLPPKKKVSDLALMIILLPESAELWLEGAKMSQLGHRREFVTPKLDAGMLYQYRIKARWTEAGKPVEREKVLLVQAGDERTIDLRKENIPSKPEAGALPEPNLFPKLELGGNGS